MSTDERSGWTRRRALQTGAAALLAGAAKATLPGGAFAQNAAGPETTKAILGFVPSTDAAPLIVAKEKGLFAKHGLTGLELRRLPSWNAARDVIALGSGKDGVDGAHLQTPTAYLLALGKAEEGVAAVPTAILARLNLDGQAISLSNEYRNPRIGADPKPLRLEFELQRATVKWVRGAVSLRGGTHDLWLRYWLAAGGIDPDKTIEISPMPSHHLAAQMRARAVDVACDCEPWHAGLIAAKFGYTALATGEIWAKHPEKSLVMRAEWTERHPRAAKALVMAVMEAQIWCDQPANKLEMANILSAPGYLNLPAQDIAPRASGLYDMGAGKIVKDSPHAVKFWRDNASYPYKSHDLWFLTETIRWGRLPAGFDARGAIEKVNREDLWREAAKSLGVKDIPAQTSRGKETFFDGKVFDPGNMNAYLASLPISRIAG